MFNGLSDWIWSRRLASAGTPMLGRETFTVQKGKRYRATIVLKWSESFVGNDYIARRFQAVGFADLKVAGNGSERIAEGRWTREDTTAEIDPHIKKIALLA